MMEKLADSDEYISRLGKVDFKIFVIFKIKIFCVFRGEAQET